MSAVRDCVCLHPAAMHRAETYIGARVSRDGVLPGYLAECTAWADGRPCGCPRYELLISVSENLWAP